MAYSYGAAGPKADNELSSKFAIEIDGIRLAAFEKCSVGDSEHAVIESRTGIDPLTKQACSGLKNIQTVTIEKNLRVGGADDLEELINWHRAGSADKRSGSIISLDRDGNEIHRLNFADGWISKWTPPEFDASSDEAQMHVFEITVPEVTWVK